MSRKVELDELEMLLNLLKSQMDADEFNKLTSKELSEILNKQHNINCSERDIFLLYEPTLQEDILDVTVHYKTLFG